LRSKPIRDAEHSKQIPLAFTGQSISGGTNEDIGSKT
jgi:hypothetical protein